MGAATDLLLKKSAEVKRVLEKGKRIPFKHCLFLMADSLVGKTRFAIIASRKVGHAVVRNRVKRLYREAIRQDYKGLSTKFPRMDIVIVVRKNLPKTYWEVVKDLKL